MLVRVGSAVPRGYFIETSERGAGMRIDGHLTRKRIDELKRHKCVISPHTNTCWKCRAYKRYCADRDARIERSKSGGTYRKVHVSPERDIVRASASYHRRKKVTE